MRAALVIPAFNEQATLASLLETITRQRPGTFHSVIVVDDGSTDATSTILRDYPVTSIRHASNQGKARALIDGMELAILQGADLVITMDADGQHRPEDIDRLLSAAKLNMHSLVVGARLAKRTNIPTDRYRANRFANFWIAWASGHAIADSQSGFRVYPAELLRKVLSRLGPRYPATRNSRDKGFVFDSEVLVEAGRLGYRTVAVSIPAIYGTARASHFRPVSDITRIVIMVAGHLLRRGMYPQGLLRSLRESKRSSPG